MFCEFIIRLYTKGLFIHVKYIIIFEVVLQSLLLFFKHENSAVC